MGKVLTGFQLIWRSRYLLLVCSNLLLTYVSVALHSFTSSGTALLLPALLLSCVASPAAARQNWAAPAHHVCCLPQLTCSDV
jgi:hypothetical protein